MSDFILVGFDYIDCIKSPDDLKIFERMKELTKTMHKPMKECLAEVIEFTQLDRKLRGLQPAKIIIQKDPKLN